MLSGTPSFLQLIFFISEARKFLFCRIVKPSFTHIGELKINFCRFSETNVLGTFLRVWLFSSVWCPKIWFFRSRETLVSWVPMLLLKYFLHFGGLVMRFTSIDWNWKVFWRKLDGLLKETGLILTETGWSIDGNWTVYWRKLDGLLTETGSSLEGNRTVYWRKLDGLDRETGWSIDGIWIVNWRKLDGLLLERVVYWWKQYSIFSSFWEPENAILPSSETRGFVDI